MTGSASPADLEYPVATLPPALAEVTTSAFSGKSAHDRKRTGIGLLVGGGVCALIGFSIQAGSFSAGTSTVDRAEYSKLRMSNGVGGGMGVAGLSLGAVGVVMLLIAPPDDDFAIRLTGGSTLGLSLEF